MHIDRSILFFFFFAYEADGMIIFLLHLVFKIVVLYEYVYPITFFSCMLQLLDANQNQQSFL